MSLIWTDMFGEHSKIDIAIQRLKDYEDQALKYDPEGYYVTDSGGKDSAVIKQLCIDAGVKFGVYHHHTSVDHPETFYFVRREKKRFEDMGYHYEITHNYDKDGKRVTMWSLIAQRGFPSRIRRFCCQQLKEGGGEGRVVVTGVRRAESTKRQSRGIAEVITKNQKDKIVLNNDNDDKRQILEHCIMRHKIVVNPIIDWEDEDVWEYIRMKNLPYNPLYDMGFKRVGCVGCPMSTHMGEELEKLPKYKNLYIYFMDRFLKSHPQSAKGATAQEWYDWWVSNGKMKFAGSDDISMFDEVDDDE